MSKKSVLSAAPVDFASQRLPLEGKLAAQPTDEVASKNWEKSKTSVKNAGFPPHPPSVRTGHLPLKGEGLWTCSPSLRCGSLTVSKSLCLAAEGFFLLFQQRSPSRIRPSVAMVTTFQGISLPLSSKARFTAFSSPPQQGTSIRTTVTLRMSLLRRIWPSFSA